MGLCRGGCRCGGGAGCLGTSFVANSRADLAPRAGRRMKPMIMAEQTHDMTAPSVPQHDLSPREVYAGGAESRPTNVGQTERTLSALAGGALTLAGLRLRSMPGLLLARLGARLVYRGVTGLGP